MNPVYEAKKTELTGLLNPAHTALIVVDPQKGYIHEDLGVPRLTGSDTSKLQAMTPRLNDSIGVARDYGVEVIWTRMREDPETAPENLRTKMLIGDIPALTTPKDGSIDFIDSVHPQKGDKVLDKVHYNPFTDTDLHEYLQSRSPNITTIVLIGAYTSRCVASTTFLGSDHLGYNVFIPEDLVGVPSKFDDNHEQEGVLSALDGILAYVVDSEFVKEAWRSHKTIS